GPGLSRGGRRLTQGCEQNGKRAHLFARFPGLIRLPAAAPSYLDALNSEQRRAVLHGTEPGTAAAPLLVIAGAGSGKTNTLAHRVAHLVVNGADPLRILLLTFSRRAAAEMS